MPLTWSRHLDLGKILLKDLDVHIHAALDTLQNVQSSAAAVAFDLIRGVGDLLQFTQHKLRDDQRALEKARFADICHASIDNHTRVEELWILLLCLP